MWSSMKFGPVVQEEMFKEKVYTGGKPRNYHKIVLT